MKFVLVLLACIATAYASLPSQEYLPPAEASEIYSGQDLQTLTDGGVLADDGYRYKTVKRYRLRHRRDVNELPSNEYLPPQASAPVADIPVSYEAPIEAPQDSAVLAQDGYRYKTVKRYRLRHRRDVNELPSNEYLPPVDYAQSAPAPVSYAAPIAAPTNEYLPPVAASQDSAVLAQDGYRYKTVKRFRIRRRRDVNELPSNEYLPPVDYAQAAPATASVSYAAPAAEYAAPTQDSAVLAQDGYRYKTVKRYRLRHRRDVNELPSSEYLPPVEAPIAYEAPVQDSGVLANDGYRYKTVKRVVYKHRS